VGRGAREAGDLLAAARRVINGRHAAWRARATELWKADRSLTSTKVADIIHRELRDAKSPHEAPLKTIRAAIADLHPYKGKLLAK